MLLGYRSRTGVGTDGRSVLRRAGSPSEGPHWHRRRGYPRGDRHGGSPHGARRGGQPQGSPRADRLQGSLGADHPKGNRGNDRLWGSGGNDKIIPGDGNDKVYAGRGDDLISARDTDGVDFIDCGPSFDKVETIHRDDVTLSNCEKAIGLRRGYI